MWVAYFSIFGGLFLLYTVVRFSLWEACRPPKGEPEDWKTDARPGTPIDASLLAKRVEQLKKDYTGELPATQDTFKKPLLVEQRREEIAQLAFFHRPKEPDPPEKDDGFAWMFV